MARWQFRPPVERVRNGFRINLDTEERELIRRLLAEMRSVMLGPSDNPALVRLFPVAYHLPQHAEQNEEFQRLMREDLVASRLAGIELIDEALTAKPPLTSAQIEAFAQGLNGLRLVLGTILDISEDDHPESVSDDDPMVGEHHLYAFLSWVLEWTIRCLTGT